MQAQRRIGRIGADRADPRWRDDSRMDWKTRGHGDVFALDLGVSRFSYMDGPHPSPCLRVPASSCSSANHPSSIIFAPWLQNYYKQIAVDLLR